MSNTNRLKAHEKDIFEEYAVKEALMLFLKLLVPVFDMSLEERDATEA